MNEKYNFSSVSERFAVSYLWISMHKIYVQLFTFIFVEFSAFQTQKFSTFGFLLPSLICYQLLRTAFYSDTYSNLIFLLQNVGLTSPLPTVALGVTAVVGVLTAIFIFQSASTD